MDHSKAKFKQFLSQFFRSRMMLVSYRFAGFKEIERRGERVIFENDLKFIQPDPDYVDVVIG